MTNVRDVPADRLIEAAAAKLEKMEQFKPPEWSKFAKTGISRERPPVQKNWWWIRAASILRKTYLNHGMGVSKLRKEYSGRKNRGHKPEHTFRASGSSIRKIMQQMEAAGFLKQEKNQKGRVIKRVITQEGTSFLNEVSKSLK